MFCVFLSLRYCTAYRVGQKTRPLCFTACRIVVSVYFNNDEAPSVTRSVCTGAQVPIKVKPESRSSDDSVTVDPLTVLHQQLYALQQQQQSVTSSVTSPHQPSSSSSSSAGSTACSDVSLHQQQQLHELQRQLLLMHGLPTIMSTTICQPAGFSSTCLLYFVCYVCYILRLSHRNVPLDQKSEH